jgi:glucose-6-phosphate 1-epimerase
VDIDALNAEYGIDGTLKLREGRSGLPMIEIQNDLASALISPHGGQILSYRPADAASDLLFVSERAHYGPGKAIKGGIPLCWPWFGQDPEGKGRPAHGFVRSLPWTLVSTATLANGANKVTLGIADDAKTRALWPYHFNLLVGITVGATLGVELITRNAGDPPFRITQGLHAYFKVADATRVRVLGLEGCRYIDKAAGGKDAVIVQEGPVTVSREVNRIYEQVPPQLVLEDPSLGRRIRIASRHSATSVVWNPWIDTARAMDDLDDEDYRVMLCVETVNTASEVIEVPGGGEARLAADYAIEPL